MTQSHLRHFSRRRVLNPRDYALIPALMLVFSLIAQPGITSWEVLVTWTIVNIVTIVLVWAAFAICRILLSRFPDSQDVSVFTLLAIGGTLGAVKALATAGFGTLAGVDPDFGASLLARMPQTLAIGSLTVWGISVGVSVRRALEVHARARVSRELARRFGGLATIDDIELPVIKRALARTRESLAGAELHPLKTTQLVESVVRPLSHELWEEAARSAPRFSIAWLDTRVVRGRLYDPVAVALVWAATSFPVHLVRGTLLEAVAWTLVAGVILAAVLEVFRRAPLGQGSKVAAYLFVALATWAFGLWQLAVWWWGSGHPLASLWIYLSALLWVSVLIVLSGVIALVPGGQLSPDPLVADINESAEGAFETDVSRRLARFLHGEVVNKLLRLSHGLTLDTRESAVLADQEKREILSRLDSGTWLHPPVSPGEAGEHFLDETVRRWRGVIRVEWEVAEGTVAESLERASAAEIVDEALVNAYRHGLAKRATISIARDELGAMVVEVRDDGVGPRDGAAGLGSTIFDRASGGKWELSALAEGGALCRVVIDGAKLRDESP